MNGAKEIRALEHHGSGATVDMFHHVTQACLQILVANHLDAAAHQQGADDAAVMRVHRRGNHHFAAVAKHVDGHHGGFGECGGAVVVRGVGHIHARQGTHQALVFKNSLQRALADLGLVRCVCRIKL